MKLICYCVLLLMFYVADAPSLFIKNDTININVKKGDKKKVIVPVKNVGEQDLIISDVMPTCGCTISSFPKAPIHKNGTANISLIFDSGGKYVGRSTVYVTIKSNAKNKYAKLTLNVNIMK